MLIAVSMLTIPGARHRSPTPSPHPATHLQLSFRGVHETISRQNSECLERRQQQEAAGLRVLSDLQVSLGRNSEARLQHKAQYVLCLASCNGIWLDEGQRPLRSHARGELDWHLAQLSQCCLAPSRPLLSSENAWHRHNAGTLGGWPGGNSELQRKYEASLVSLQCCRLPIGPLNAEQLSCQTRQWAGRSHLVGRKKYMASLVCTWPKALAHTWQDPWIAGRLQ